jgi:hypothetical protein
MTRYQRPADVFHASRRDSLAHKLHGFSQRNGLTVEEGLLQLLLQTLGTTPHQLSNRPNLQFLSGDFIGRLQSRDRRYVFDRDGMTGRGGGQKLFDLVEVGTTVVEDVLVDDRQLVETGLGDFVLEIEANLGVVEMAVVGQVRQFEQPTQAELYQVDVTVGAPIEVPVDPEQVTVH